MDAQRFHVFGQPVAAVAARVCDISGLSNAAGVWHDQPPEPAQAVQVTEIRACLAGPSGKQTNDGQPQVRVADLDAALEHETGGLDWPEDLQRRLDAAPVTVSPFSAFLVSDLDQLFCHPECVIRRNLYEMLSLQGLAELVRITGACRGDGITVRFACSSRQRGTRPAYALTGDTSSMTLSLLDRESHERCSLSRGRADLQEAS